MNENELQLARLDDKIAICARDYTVTYTNFLDAPSTALAKSHCQKAKVRFAVDGGYEGAERSAVFILPDYAESPADCFDEKDYPICIFRVKNKNPDSALSHRDYLGALMALGIKRETLGDILVREHGADIIILRSVASFLLQNCDKIGNAPVEGTVVPVSEAQIPEKRIKEIRDTVASPRLDAIISGAFSLSRSDAVHAIEAGIVYVNDEPVVKPDYTVHEGAKLVLRGKGKAVLRAFSGESKKGRTVVLFDRYL